jgi:hypothetical protein
VAPCMPLTACRSGRGHQQVLALLDSGARAAAAAARAPAAGTARGGHGVKGSQHGLTAAGWMRCWMICCSLERHLHCWTWQSCRAVQCCRSVGMRVGGGGVGAAAVNDAVGDALPQQPPGRRLEFSGALNNVESQSLARRGLEGEGGPPWLSPKLCYRALQ